MFNGIAFNEDYYIEYIKSEFNKLSNNLVKAHIKDISYMVDYVNNGEKLKERPINLEDIRDKKILMNAKVLNILGVCLMKIRIKNQIFIRLKK